MVVKRRSRFNSKRKRAPTNKQLDKKIKKLQSDKELKYTDTYNTNDIFNTGTLLLLNPVVRGAEPDQRIGNLIRATSLQYRGHISTDLADTALAAIRVRLIIFWDRQANGIAPTLIGASTTASVIDTSTVTDATLAPYNHNMVERYKILTDRHYIIVPKVVGDFDPATGTTTYFGQNAMAFNGHIKLSRKIRFDESNNGDITDIMTNSLYIGLLSDRAVAATNPFLELGTRMYYKDE